MRATGHLYPVQGSLSTDTPKPIYSFALTGGLSSGNMSATLQNDEVCSGKWIIGSGTRTREVVEDSSLMTDLEFDPARQWLGAQCSRTLVLAKLGFLDGVPACTDLKTKPCVEKAGVKVLNQPFYAKGRVATAGGCLASQYLAAWLISNLVDTDAARSALHYVAPVGEKDEYVSRAMRNVEPYLLRSHTEA